MLHRFILPMVGLCVLWTAGPTQSAVVTLSPTADVRILSFFPNSNEGNGGLLAVYTQPGNVQRTLLQFNLSGIPIGQQIDSAVLTLHPNPSLGDNANGLNMDVHAVTKAWSELQVTWDSASAGNAWATAGGDFDPFVYATSKSTSNVTPINWDVTSLVKNWYDGSLDNFGMLIRSFNGNELHFNSDEVADANLRPTLMVTYSVPEASSLLMLGVGIITGLGLMRFRRALSTR